MDYAARDTLGVAPAPELDADVARVISGPDAAGVRAYLVMRELVLAADEPCRLTRDALAELLVAALVRPEELPRPFGEVERRLRLAELPRDARLHRLADALYALYHVDANIRGPLLHEHRPT